MNTHASAQGPLSTVWVLAIFTGAAIPVTWLTYTIIGFGQPLPTLPYMGGVLLVFLALFAIAHWASKRTPPTPAEQPSLTLAMLPDGTYCKIGEGMSPNGLYSTRLQMKGGAHDGVVSTVKSDHDLPPEFQIRKGTIIKQRWSRTPA